MKILVSIFTPIICLILMSSAFPNKDVYNDTYDPPKSELETYVETAGIFARENNIDINLVCALISCESSWDKNAVHFNSKGKGKDQGLMQLNSRYLIYFSMKFNEGFIFDPHDPFINIKVGVRYLKWIRDNIKGCKNSWRNTLIYWNGSGKTSGRFADKVLSLYQ